VLKPPRFSYARPQTLADAAAMLRHQAGGAKIIAGGQSLTPMLNLRVAAPTALIDINRIASLSCVEVTRDAGAVARRSGGFSIPIAEIARRAYLPAAGDFGGETPGLEATVGYEPPLMTQANSTHLATVEVDSATGEIRIDRYIVVEDCGTIINPLVVDGQIQGGVAQGIGSALLEEIVYYDAGQVLTGTLMDYLAPTAAEVPCVQIAHIETPSPFTAGGFKGMGEGGAIAAPAAIANALADALAPLDARVNRIPLTPERVLAIIAAASQKEYTRDKSRGARFRRRNQDAKSKQPKSRTRSC
jgi:aerobic carbon-monoxide dehydrogenase large subunit